MRTEYDDVIRAWLDGAEVEEMHPVYTEGQWKPLGGLLVVDDINWQLRIVKPAKEPKYLYVYLVENVVKFSQQKDGAVPPVYSMTTTDIIQTSKYFGKIRLEE